MSDAIPSQIGFTVSKRELSERILLPKFYDPAVGAEIEAIANIADFITLRELRDAGMISLGIGMEVGSSAYGSGSVPFVRTSDLSNWEIKSNPKQGVAERYIQQVPQDKSVEAGDILLARDGTYLVGTASLVSSYDVPCIYQSHLVRIRVHDRAPIGVGYLLAALRSRIVQRQLQARRFTADIIDTLGDRYLDVQIPILRDEPTRQMVNGAVFSATNRRVALRRELDGLPYQVSRRTLPSQDVESDYTTIAPRHGFVVRHHQISSRILLARYYDPFVHELKEAMASDCDFISISALEKAGEIDISTGIEVGKMAYGTGDIPFFRTSDMANWELKSDPKHRIASTIHDMNSSRATAKPKDILLVRDGTYLIGTSAIVSEEDCPMLFAGGIYRVRIPAKSALDPYLLLVLLNTSVVQRQIRARQFTRNIIDTIGRRFYDIEIPYPKDPLHRQQLTDRAEEIMFERAQLRRTLDRQLLQFSEGTDDSI